MPDLWRLKYSCSHSSHSWFQITNLWGFAWWFRCFDCCGVVALIVGVPTLRFRGLPRNCDTWGFWNHPDLIVNGGTLNGAVGTSFGLPLQLGNWFTSLLSLQRSLRLTSYAVQLGALPLLFVKMKSQQNLLGSIRQSQSHCLCIWCDHSSDCWSLQAGFIGSVPKDYSFTNTINVLIIVVFGGLGSMSEQLWQPSSWGSWTWCFKTSQASVWSFTHWLWFSWWSSVQVVFLAWEFSLKNYSQKGG